jgi:PAS domain S-box-containing protein
VEGRRRAGAAFPFIVYTATYTEPKDETTGPGLGAEAFMVKPAEPEVFMQRLNEVLSKNQGGQLPLRTPVLDETTALHHHRDVLVDKLAEKAAQLEQRVAELAVSEKHIHRLNLLYRVLSETNQAIVHLADENELFQTICRTAVERGGFAMAWVGLLDAQRERITPVAWSGPVEAWFSTLGDFSLQGPPRAPVEIALRENRIYVSNQLTSEPLLQPIHAALRQAGLNSAISAPLHTEGHLVGALTLFAAEPDYFDPAMHELVVEISSDISFALGNFEREKQRRLAEERLRQSEEANRLTQRAVEASANGIMITAIEPGGNLICYVNPAFEHITGYSSTEVLGRDPRFLRGSDHQQIGATIINAALKDGRDGKAMLRNYRKDGSLFWNELSIAPVLDAGGTVHPLCRHHQRHHRAQSVRSSSNARTTRMRSPGWPAGTCCVTVSVRRLPMPRTTSVLWPCCSLTSTTSSASTTAWGMARGRHVAHHCRAHHDCVQQARHTGTPGGRRVRAASSPTWPAHKMPR